MRSLNSFAFATVVAAILLFIMATQPVAGGPISITSPDVLLHSVSRIADSWHATGDLDCNARLTWTGGSVRMNAELGDAALPSDGAYDFTTAFLTGELVANRTFTSPPLEQSATWITPTGPTSGGGLAAPTLTPDLVFSTGNLADYAWTLLSRVTEPKASTNGENSVASAGSDRHPTILAASEPNQLAYVAGVAAFGGVWHLGRFRRRSRPAAA